MVVFVDVDADKEGGNEGDENPGLYRSRSRPPLSCSGVDDDDGGGGINGDAWGDVLDVGSRCC